MKKQKLTPWFSPEVKPVREGVYLTRVHLLRHIGVYRLWRDGVWHTFGETRSAAARGEPLPAGFKRAWRGLAEQPK